MVVKYENICFLEQMLVRLFKGFTKKSPLVYYVGLPVETLMRCIGFRTQHNSS